MAPNRTNFPQFALALAGWILMASGLFHFGWWVAVGGSWEGAVSWRKPILFGISSGLTLLSMAWMLPKLRARRWDGLICGSCALAMLAEVALITIQQWRGEPSHFNQSSPIDKAIGVWMTVLIVIVTLVVFDFAIRCFQYFDGPADLRLAVRGGMALLVISCLIGFVILYYGERRAELGLDPSVFGRGGVTKFPHGIAIHAIQLLPCLVGMMGWLGIDERIRYRLAGQCIASIAVGLIFSLVQTFSGLGRFEMSLPGFLLLIVAVLLAMPTAIQIGFASFRRWRVVFGA